MTDPSDIRIETPRLILRPPRAEDLDGFAAFGADPVASHYVGGVQTRNLAWRAMCCMAGAWSLFGFSMFSVIEKDSGRWIGRLGPWAPEGWPAPEVGWGLLPEVWGRGYATEGAAAAMDFAFETLGWTDVVHIIHRDNANSRGVARRLGSRLLGPAPLPAPFENEPADLYGQSAADWAQNRAGLTAGA